MNIYSTKLNKVHFLLALFLSTQALSNQYQRGRVATDSFQCVMKFHGDKTTNSRAVHFEKNVVRKRIAANNKLDFYKGSFLKVLNLKNESDFFGAAKLEYEFRVKKGPRTEADFRICLSGSFIFNDEKVKKECIHKVKIKNNKSFRSSIWFPTKMVSGLPAFVSSKLRPLTLFSKKRYLEPMMSVSCRHDRSTIRTNTY